MVLSFLSKSVGDFHPYSPCGQQCWLLLLRQFSPFPAESDSPPFGKGDLRDTSFFPLLFSRKKVTNSFLEIPHFFFPPEPKPRFTVQVLFVYRPWKKIGDDYTQPDSYYCSDPLASRSTTYITAKTPSTNHITAVRRGALFHGEGRNVKTKKRGGGGGNAHKKGEGRKGLGACCAGRRGVYLPPPIGERDGEGDGHTPVRYFSSWVAGKRYRRTPCLLHIHPPSPFLHLMLPPHVLWQREGEEKRKMRSQSWIFTHISSYFDVIQKTL